MDVQVAAVRTKELIPLPARCDDGMNPISHHHLHDMCVAIMEGKVTGEKAHRWLGWVQACCCVHGLATLEELKEINHNA